MSNAIAIGFSQAEDIKEAAHQASVAVKNQLNSITTDFVLVFASIGYIHKDALDVIHTILKPKKLIGSSTLGIILGNGIYKRGIGILAINSADFHVGIASHDFKTNLNHRQLGFELSRQMVADYKSPLPRRAAVILYDPLIPFKNVFTLGTREVLGLNLKTAGAFSCDDFKLKDSYQIIQKKILNRNIAGFIIGCESEIIVGNRHGFKPLGKPRMVTSSKDNIIITIDNKPAISIYEEYLKKEAQDIRLGLLNSAAVFYPLGIYQQNLRQYLLRYPIDILSDGSIVCQAEIPPKTEVHLMISNKDSCRASAALTAQEVKDSMGKREAQVLLVFNSMTKSKILGRNSSVELESIQRVFGSSVPIFGMYSFGELSPLGINENEMETYLQNGSLTIIAIS